MISVSFDLANLPLAQVLDSTKQMLRQSSDNFARVVVRQQTTNNLYFIEMHKFPDGSIREQMWTTSVITEQDAKDKEAWGVDTLSDR